jgi:eukaryotic-like serine/threonine-protein kinase
MLGRVFLGRYETIRLLGEGGMGRVYLARQLDLGRQVVVKVMHDHIAADATFRERFQRETLLMARFQHPYAVTLYDASLSDPGACIVMEYIRGVTLDALLASNKRLDPLRVDRLLHQLCEVLQAAHAVGIVHRDLKPANLMVVDPDTPYEMMKVMDFGLAKLLGPEATVTVTNHEFAVGTPGYMCPEQARGEEMDHRGDLYSVGVILFELLTGQLPFAGRSTMDILLAHATEEPPSFSLIGVSGLVPPAIESVVQSCLAKLPEQRPSHARELSEMFTEALGSSSHTTQSPSTVGATGSRSPRIRPPRRSSLGLPMSVPPAAYHPGGGAEGALMPAPGVRPSACPTPPGPRAEHDQPVPDPVVVKAPAPTTPMPLADPLAVVHLLEAWMPEKIATFKLRGFIQDVGGELVESVPGRISVRLGGKGCVYLAPARGLSWLGLGRRAPIDLELRLNRTDSGRENHLKITVVFRSSGNDLNADIAWRTLCTQIYCDLRGYLMGQNGDLGDSGM